MPSYHNQLQRMGGRVEDELDQSVVHHRSPVSAVNRLSSYVHATTVLSEAGKVSALQPNASTAGYVAASLDRAATANAMNPGKGNDAASPTQRPSPYS
ncbi:MAG: hypothetical protein DHS20C10_06480 [marine bacterium B5-7]|nr:MAG: hypothetical protein DHS20C10_06480 [marine bacterium B5-7]